MKALIAALMLVCATSVWAEGKPLACQEDEKAGPVWENGRWNVHSFIPRKFILVMDGDTLTRESVYKVFCENVEQKPTPQMTCTNVYRGYIRCEDLSGA